MSRSFFVPSRLDPSGPTLEIPLAAASPSPRTRRRVAAFLAVVPFVLAHRAAAQEFGTIFRGDEIGPRQLDFDEETYLNIFNALRKALA